MMSNIIDIQGLTKSYGGSKAVEDITLTIREGELFGLIGPNGAGKTTTLSILSTLLAPDSGSVRVGGHDVVKAAHRIKPLIGLVPQDLAIYPTLSARKNLAFFGRIYGNGGRALGKRIEHVLDLVNLTARGDDPAGRLSGGMQRRLNIAVGLIHAPKILFLDEPTVGVDPQSRNFIFEHIERLKSEGMTIVYTTHYMEEAERLCDRIAIMDSGKVRALDTTEGLLSLLGGGVLLARLDGAKNPLKALQSMEFVSSASEKNGRIKLEVNDAKRALIELIGLSRDKGWTFRSLQILEPNLESVFLHLTGKRLRD